MYIPTLRIRHSCSCSENMNYLRVNTYSKAETVVIVWEVTRHLHGSHSAKDKSSSKLGRGKYMKIICTWMMWHAMIMIYIIYDISYTREAMLWRALMRKERRVSFLKTCSAYLLVQLLWQFYVEENHGSNEGTLNWPGGCTK